jgi:hypothetical protein
MVQTDRLETAGSPSGNARRAAARGRQRFAQGAARRGLERASDYPSCGQNAEHEEQADRRDTCNLAEQKIHKSKNEIEPDLDINDQNAPSMLWVGRPRTWVSAFHTSPAPWPSPKNVRPGNRSFQYGTPPGRSGNSRAVARIASEQTSIAETGETSDGS